MNQDQNMNFNNNQNNQTNNQMPVNQAPLMDNNMNVNNIVNPIEGPIPMPNTQVNSVNSNQSIQYYSQGNTPTQNGGSNNNKNIFIVIGVILVVIVIALLIIFIFRDKDENNTASNNSIPNYSNVVNNVIDDLEKEVKKEKDGIVKSIKFKVADELKDDSHNSLVLSLNSTNKKFINVSIPVKFYDADGVQVKEETAYFMCVESGMELYDVINLYNTKYDSYKIDESSIDAYYANEFQTCHNYKGKIDYKFEMTDDKDINIVFTNNTEYKISIEGIAMFYKDNKLIGMDTLYTDYIDASGKLKEEVYSPYDYDKHDKADYDDKKFVFSSVIFRD